MEGLGVHSYRSKFKITNGFRTKALKTDLSFYFTASADNTRMQDIGRRFGIFFLIILCLKRIVAKLLSLRVALNDVPQIKKPERAHFKMWNLGCSGERICDF